MHTAAELDVALRAGAAIIGINNRDLRTFETHIETTLALLPLIPPGPIVVSESGFSRGDEVRRVVAAGAHAVLVGEGLVRAPTSAEGSRASPPRIAMSHTPNLARHGGASRSSGRPSAGGMGCTSHPA